MKLIDINQDGFIDEKEFELLFLNTNDIEYIPKRRTTNKLTQTKEEREIITNLQEKLERYHIKPKTLFYLADKDDSKTISLLELREALQTVLPH